MENLLINLLPKERYSVLFRYFASVIIVGVACLLRIALSAEMQHYPVLLFIPAVFVCALLFDRGSGFFATIVSALLAAYFFIEPVGSFRIEPTEIVPLLLFIAIGFTISAVTEALRQTIRKLAQVQEQKSLLLEELGHRTKNDLMMISSVLTLQAKSQPDENVRAALDGAVARVSVIAQAQERLRGDRDGGLVELCGYLTDLCRGLGDMLRDVRPIAVLVDADKFEVDSSSAVSVGLIVNELVTNCFKYAFPDGAGGTVWVSFRAGDDSLEIAVADDGVGCPPAPALGLGSRLVRLLAGQMKGQVTQREVPRGCTVVVQIPRDAVNTGN
jgi:two-component sensor histidine kinase